jgi:plastocyanin
MVSVRDNFFQPSTVSVVAGRTVCWTGQGLNSHTVTADDSSFDSGGLPTGQTFRVTFNAPGRVVGYHCIFHLPTMVGKVRVLPKRP